MWVETAQLFRELRLMVRGDKFPAMPHRARLTYLDVERPVHVRERLSPRIAAALQRHTPSLLLFLAVYRLLGLSFGEMQQWDESIYALRTMAVFTFGDVWDQAAHMPLGPYYAAHPPLYVWLSTVAVVFFGDGLFAFRLVSALAGAGTVALLYRTARQMLPRGPALAAAGFVALMPLAVFFSRQGQLDALLTLFILASVHQALRYVRRGGIAALAAGGACLGLALLTKQFFGLAVPAGLLLASRLLDGPQRRRATRASWAMLLVSLPFWLPWTLSFIFAHGHGNPLFLLSAELPAGRTLRGSEGASPGMFYYANQLAVHLSFLFPLALTGLYDGLTRRRSAGEVVLSTVALAYLGGIWLLPSKFVVYLLPAVPLLVLSAMKGAQRARTWPRGGRTAMGMVMGVCAAWSLSAGWRAALRSLAASPRSWAADAGSVQGVLLLVAAVATALCIVLLLRRLGRLRALFSSVSFLLLLIPLAGATFMGIWVTDPRERNDGAVAAVRAVRASGAHRVVLVGNGDNPQLTWYFHGENEGWPCRTHRVFERCEPHRLGAAQIARNIAANALRERVAVVVERDEIAQGVYSSIHDVLPPGADIRSDVRRYAVAVVEGPRR
jgi:4-amino-4-deoxy-L-arabinose transferase-like glycosyltransferase